MPISLKSGETAVREHLLLFANTGTSDAPEWAIIGRHVESSDMEYDYSKEDKKDIVGNTYSELKKPIVTQTFDSIPVMGGDPVIERIYDNTRRQDISAMTQNDLLVVHKYAGEAAAYEAERYTASTILCTRQGGDGGGFLTYGLDVTFGGDHELGTATIAAGGSVTFSKEE